MSEVIESASKYAKLRKQLFEKIDPLDRHALEDCLELLDDTIVELEKAISDLSPNKSADEQYTDLQTLFSGAMTNQYTCLDGFAYTNKNVWTFLQKSLKMISKHVSNSLSMLKKLRKSQKKSLTEIFSDYGELKNGFPTWLKKNERTLLQKNVNETKFDLVVAQDGSGDYSTINEALHVAHNSSHSRFVIYIKEGAYFEYIEIPRKKGKIMLVGDGIGKTWIKGNRSVIDGWTTFRSATVAVVGNNFIAKGISFENFAGPSKHQAVALRSGSDYSVFYQCSFIGYQDTLYVHSFRQFYKECDVYGTVDFIFGNAAVVFQNCSLYARKPDEHQKNMFTAQGRQDPNQNTGIQIMNSKIAAAADLIPVQSQVKSYLGRPWKEYSRTIILYSNIGDLIDPAGWMEWSGDYALSTLYYGEFKNRGPGSNTSARVTWPGFRVIQ
ncbi:esterase [Lithospermum erythrorhizon]|uniref:Pectinesterase n=1 Tax=Lithospermum erythrorhizon TaxID=34254 RepID=A0AAV3NHG8_LITER